MFSKSLSAVLVLLAFQVGANTSSMSWRSSSTQPNQSGKVSSTSAERESYINRKEAWQVSMINGTMLGHSDTPPFYFVPAAGIKTLSKNDSGGTHGHFSDITVSGLGPTGILHGTLLLPVSGHNGFANAQKWAKQDTYQVLMQYMPEIEAVHPVRQPGGQMLISSGRSLDLVTKQEIIIQMKPGQSVRLMYWRNGSLGIGGYPEGRLIKISWDGK